MPEYTRSILEQELTKGEQLATGWPWRLLVFSLIIFGTTVFLYFAVDFGYTAYLDSQFKSSAQKLSDLNGQLEGDEPKALINLYSQLVNIKSLLDTHALPSKLLALLEGSTDPGVYFSSLNFSSTDKNLKLEGVASDYNVLVRQLEIFRKNQSIDSVFLDGSQARDQGGVQFSLRLIARPDLFK